MNAELRLKLLLGDIACSLNPACQQKVPEYAAFLLKVKKFDEALRIIGTIKGDPKLNLG